MLNLETVSIKKVVTLLPVLCVWGKKIMYTRAITVGGTCLGSGEKPKVKKRWIRHDKKQEREKKLEWRLGRRWGAQEEDLIKKKRYSLSQGSGCHCDLVAFAVPPFHCDLTLSQGETRDKNTDLSSISHLTPSHIPPWPLHLRRADALTVVCLLKMKPNSLNYWAYLNMHLLIWIN